MNEMSAFMGTLEDSVIFFLSFIFKKNMHLNEFWDWFPSLNKRYVLRQSSWIMFAYEKSICL